MVLQRVTLNDEQRERKHEGLFYRAKESFYYSQSSGVFHNRLTLSPLKRMSCKGCNTCDYIEEMISETGDDIQGLIKNIKSDKVYKLSVKGGRYWTDCGYEYDSWLELNEVKQNDSTI